MGKQKIQTYFVGSANIKSTVKIYHTDRKIPENTPKSTIKSNIKSTGKIPQINAGVVR